MNQLDQLRKLTTIVADTGDLKEISRFSPTDATTNPSLILRAALQPEYRPLLEETVARHGRESHESIIDRILARFGSAILEIVPGRVSVEVDARASFQVSTLIARGRRIASYFVDEGVDRDRVLIKLAATWEGIRAAHTLEREGIHCNLTLVFGMCQAAACAQAGVTLISPFVGRIHDWHKRAAGAAWDAAVYTGIADPGVQSVLQIYRHFKRFGISTQIMGASFRNIDQVLALAGCDLLTISPGVLAQLQSRAPTDLRGIDVSPWPGDSAEPLHFAEDTFRFALNDDPMVNEKLAEGIRLFAADAVLLDRLVGALSRQPIAA